MNRWENFVLTDEDLDYGDYDEIKHRLNDPRGALREMIEEQVAEFITDTWPLDQDRLIARQQFERWYRSAVEGDSFFSSFILDGNDRGQNRRLFERQNAEADAYHRQRNVVVAFEQGRSSIQDAMAFQLVPSAFAVPLSHPTPGNGTSGKIETGGNPVSCVPSTEVDPVGAADPNLKLSEALKLYLAYGRAEKLSADGLSTVRLIIQFVVDEFDDPVLFSLTAKDFDKLDQMMAEIPNRNNIPRAAAATLSLRYRYAKEHGWDGLVRLTGETLKKGYHSALSKFFRWAIAKGHFAGEKPVFNFVSGENLTSLPRDSFRGEEVIEIISMPLFTGCDGAARIWKPGDYFIQNHLYWAYIILLLTGLRTGEIGRLRISDFVERDNIWYLDLRGFDPTKGRVPIKDVVSFKTEGSARIMPLHPLILDLGLLDRLAELESIGCDFAFPEWEPYFKPDGEPRWGQPMTKSWAYMNGKTSIVRKDVTLYSTRHFFADLIDNTDLTHRARKRLMGHSNKNDMSTRYGSKTRLTTRDLKELAEVRNPTIDQMSEILLAAKMRSDEGELKAFKPWLNRASWSGYYQQKMALTER
ncbi:hypothetical protein C8J34_104127 [Rhizobium sp. PP-F2F-G36]|nr:hypothetical protein C8J34_104127 [Rhizobium sp. PP-F2F-G36]